MSSEWNLIADGLPGPGEAVLTEFGCPDVKCKIHHVPAEVSEAGEWFVNVKEPPQWNPVSSMWENGYIVPHKGLTPIKWVRYPASDRFS